MTPSPCEVPGRGAVVHLARQGIDAIDQYSRRLTLSLKACGVDVSYVDGGTSALFGGSPLPDWVIIQYQPFSWGRWGFAPTLLRDVTRLRRQRIRVALMVHEAWVEMRGPRTIAMGLWQRAQLLALLTQADLVMASTERLVERLDHGAHHMPVPSTITIDHPGPARERVRESARLVVALYGRAHPSRAVEHAEAAITALAMERGPAAIEVRNLGADAPPLSVPTGVKVDTPGALREPDLVHALRTSDLVLLPYRDGVSTRRSTLATALALGRPVVGLRGAHTDTVLAEADDALALAPSLDPADYAHTVLAVAADPARLSSLGAAGERLYRERFDWPVLAARMTHALSRSSTGPCWPRG